MTTITTTNASAVSTVGSIAGSSGGRVAATGNEFDAQLMQALNARDERADVGATTRRDPDPSDPIGRHDCNDRNDRPVGERDEHRDIGESRGNRTQRSTRDHGVRGTRRHDDDRDHDRDDRGCVGAHDETSGGERAHRDERGVRHGGEHHHEVRTDVVVTDPTTAPASSEAATASAGTATGASVDAGGSATDASTTATTGDTSSVPAGAATVATTGTGTPLTLAPDLVQQVEEIIGQIEPPVATDSASGTKTDAHAATTADGSTTPPAAPPAAATAAASATTAAVPSPVALPTMSGVAAAAAAAGATSAPHTGASTDADVDDATTDTAASASTSTAATTATNASTSSTAVTTANDPATTGTVDHRQVTGAVHRTDGATAATPAAAASAASAGDAASTGSGSGSSSGGRRGGTSAGTAAPVGGVQGSAGGTKAAVEPSTAAGADATAATVSDPRAADAGRTAKPLLGHVDTRRLDMDLGDEGLGPLRMHTFTQGGSLHVSLQAADPQVRDAIARQSYELRRDFESAGISLGSFDVTAQGQGHDGTAAQGQPGRNVADRQGGSPSRDTAPAAVTTTTRRTRTATAGLDLKL